MGRWFNWPPFKLYAIDADTGKPLDPDVRRKTYVTYYDVKKSSRNSSKAMVAHKADEEVKAVTTEDVKKNDSNGNGNSEKKDDGNANDNKASEEKKDATKDEQSGGDKPKAEFTAEEDEKLKQMKSENKSWKIIAEEMGKAQHVLKAHWKEIDPSKAGNHAAAAEGKKGDEAKKEEDKKDDSKPANEEKKGSGGHEHQGKQGKKNKNKNKEQQEEKPKSEPKKSEKGSEKRSEKKSDRASKPSSQVADLAANDTRFTMSEWLTLQEDDTFSFGELQCLSELIMKDQGQSWLRISARFFDLTGRRVHPDDVREKFEGMAAMV